MSKAPQATPGPITKAAGRIIEAISAGEMDTTVQPVSDGVVEKTVTIGKDTVVMTLTQGTEKLVW